MHNKLRTLFYIVLSCIVLSNTYNIFKMSPTYINNIIRNNSYTLEQLEKTVEENKEIITELNYIPTDIIDANVIIGTNSSGGSGSIIKIDKQTTYILTAYHVIDEQKVVLNKEKGLKTISISASTIKVIIKGKEYSGTIVKIDKKLDIAIIKVNKKFDIIPIKIAKKMPNIGETVWMLANPGFHKNILNRGIFNVTYSDYNVVSTAGFFGSSGGMVLNTKGEQIGVINNVLITQINIVFPSITIYNEIIRTDDLNAFLKGLL